MAEDLKKQYVDRGIAYLKREKPPVVLFDVERDHQGLWIRSFPIHSSTDKLERAMSDGLPHIGVQLEAALQEICEAATQLGYQRTEPRGRVRLQLISLIPGGKKG